MVSTVVTSDGGVRFEVRVRPRARQSGIVGVRANMLLVDVASAPVDGAANAELLAALAAAFGIAKQHVTMVRGQTLRTKLIEIRGLALEDVNARIELALGARSARP